MKMKKVFIIAALCIIATSCSVTKFVTTGDYKLSEVEPSSDVSDKGSMAGNTYTDGVVSITPVMERDHISINVTNNSSSSIKVDWDNGAYIDEFGNAHRIIHTGTKLVDKEKAQVASIVPKGSQINDIVSPSDYVEYDTTLGWQYTPLMQGSSYSSKEEALANLDAFQPVKLLIPIVYEGTTREYTFTFVGYNLGVEEVQQVVSKKSWGVYYGVCGGIILASLIVIAAV